MVVNVSRRTCGRLLCEITAFLAALPVLGAVDLRPGTVHWAPAAIRSPFPAHDLPEDEQPTGARPVPMAMVVSTSSTVYIERFHLTPPPGR
jgi:hypothetical protein